MLREHVLAGLAMRVELALDRQDQGFTAPLDLVDHGWRPQEAHEEVGVIDRRSEVVVAVEARHLDAVLIGPESDQGGLPDLAGPVDDDRAEGAQRCLEDPSGSAFEQRCANAKPLFPTLSTR